MTGSLEKIVLEGDKAQEQLEVMAKGIISEGFLDELFKLGLVLLSLGIGFILPSFGFWSDLLFISCGIGFLFSSWFGKKALKRV